MRCLQLFFQMEGLQMLGICSDQVISNSINKVPTSLRACLDKLFHKYL